MKPPTVVTDSAGADCQLDGVTQGRVSWSQVREVAVEVVVSANFVYSEALWQLSGEGDDFVVPVELIVGADEFNVALFALPGFDHEAYRLARVAEAASCKARFVCWKRGKVTE